MIKDFKIFLQHILDAISRIETYVKGVSKDEFIKNQKIQDATFRCLEIIGEAVKNLPDKYKQEHPAIEWKKIAGMRDKLIHQYFDLDLDLVWLTIQKDIPLLKKQINKLL